MSTVQQAKVSLSIIDTLLALETHHKRGVILVDTADLQELVDDYKRLKEGLQTIVDSDDRYYVGTKTMQDCAETLLEGGAL